jgi:sortase (surface protein transpeptidase)
MLVNETDIRVMLPTKGKKEITLSACRPIGTAKQRWINRAELTSEKILDYEISKTKGKSNVIQTTTGSNSVANIATGD